MISRLIHKVRKLKTLPHGREKIPAIKERVNWGLGEEPPSVAPGQQPDYLKEVVGYPLPGLKAANKPLQFGRIYYPSNESGDPLTGNLPVVIFLHAYDYSYGFAKGGSEVFTITGDIINKFVEAGYAVYVFDQIGFGTRIEEGRLFYERFPHWSKMGRMVADVRWSVDALSELEFIDPLRIYTAGYALGGTVGLYSAALDDRIAGVISVGGFTPMRLNKSGKTAEGIYEYSHLHGLLPRLGFFAENEAHIPYDFHEILAAIAPRPLLIVAPSWDQYAVLEDVQQCVTEVRKVYGLYKTEQNLDLFVPADYGRFSPEMQQHVVQWLNKR